MSTAPATSKNWFSIGEAYGPVLRADADIFPSSKQIHASVLNLGPAFSFLYISDKEVGLQLSADSSCIIGYEQKDLHNYGFLKLLRLVHPEDRSAFVNGLRTVKKNIIEQNHKENLQAHFGIDFRFHHKNGTYFRIIMQCVLLKADTRSNHFHWSGVCTDIDFFKPKGQVSIFYQDNSGKKIRLASLHTKRKRLAFSRREYDVLKLLAQGLTSREIEQQLNISQHTVRTHRRNMHRKCKVDTTTQLVKLAITEGYI